MPRCPSASATWRRTSGIQPTTTKKNIGDNADKHARELAAHGAAHSSAKKLGDKEIAENFLITTIKGISCNWMVCKAVFLCGQAQDMAGKMVGIAFPISAFVATGFDHIPADMFMVPLGLLAGAGASVLEMLYKKFLPYHA